MAPWHRVFLVFVLLAAGCDPDPAGPDAEPDDGTPADAEVGPDADADAEADADADTFDPDDAGADDADAFDPDDAGVDDAEIDEDADAGETTLPPLRDDALDPDFRWDEKARRLLDRGSLAARFAAAGYTLPAGTEVYAVRIIEGLDGPAYLLHEAGAGAFSTGFWPASTVKVLAALGALDFVGTLGFTGAATITFDTGFVDRLRSIIDRAIRVSSNEDYDWTVRVAGFDRLNDEFLTPERGFPTVVIQRSYTGTGVRHSPGMVLAEGGREATVPPRDGVVADRCPPRDGNCANLFELVEAIRRLTLDAELPASHRLEVDPADVAAMVDALCGSSSSYMRPGATRLFGAGVRVCNKTGTVLDNDYLDTGLVEDPVTGDRFLLAFAVPEQGGYVLSTTAAEAVGERVLAALAALPADGVALQPDGGLPLTAQLDDRGTTGDSRRAYTLTIEAAGADRVELSTDGWPIGEAAGPGPRFTVDYAYSSGGDRLLVIRAFRSGTLVGYRSMAVHITPP